MDTLRCRAFLTAVECGQISRAAELMGYTQSGLSRLIAGMEEELGFPLLVRSKHGVMPTTEGEALLPAVREFLRQENRIDQIAADLKGLVTGNINISAFSSVATHWLPEILKRFESEYPGVRVGLMEGTFSEIVERVLDKSADLGFFSRVEGLDIDWIPLAQVKVVAVLPPDHPLASRKSVAIEEIANERFIIDELRNDDDASVVLGRKGLKPDVRFTTRDSYSAAALVEKGLGISIMNELITTDMKHRIVTVPIEPVQYIEFGMGVPNRKEASPAVLRFMDFVVDVMEEYGYPKEIS